MDHVTLVQVVHGLEHLANRFRCILFGKLALLANAVEQFAPGSELRDNVPFILEDQAYWEVREQAVLPWTQTTRGT